MRQKGQLSLDYILAFLVLIVFVIGFQALAREITKNQQVSGLINQETIIGNNIAHLIASAKALSGNDSLVVEYEVPALQVAGAGGVGCDITIVGGQITITPATEAFGLNETDAMKRITFSPPSGINFPANAKCGEKISITKT